MLRQCTSSLNCKHPCQNVASRMQCTIISDGEWISPQMPCLSFYWWYLCVSEVVRLLVLLLVSFGQFVVGEMIRHQPSTIRGLNQFLLRHPFLDNMGNLSDQSDRLKSDLFKDPEPWFRFRLRLLGAKRLNRSIFKKKLFIIFGSGWIFRLRFEGFAEG